VLLASGSHYIGYWLDNVLFTKTLWLHYYLILKRQLCQNSLWMVGVDRGNPPAKGGTTAVNLPNTVVLPSQARRQQGTPAVCITLAEAHHSLAMLHAAWTCGLPHMYDCWLMFRTDLRHDWSHAKRRAVLRRISYTAIRHLTQSLAAAVAVRAVTAAYRAYPVTVLSRHIWCHMDVLLALFYTTITQLQWSRGFRQPCRK